MNLPEFVAVEGTFDSPVMDIMRGRRTLTPIDTRKTVDELNEFFGVVPQQIAAMRAGLKHGWNSPLADPDVYNARGKLI